MARRDGPRLAQSLGILGSSKMTSLNDSFAGDINSPTIHAGPLPVDTPLSLIMARLEENVFSITDHEPEGGEEIVKIPTISYLILIVRIIFIISILSVRAWPSKSPISQSDPQIFTI